MVQITTVVLKDDLDGSNAKESVKFGLDGVSYEIDLSEENAKELRDSLTKWVQAGRRTGGRVSRNRGAASKLDAQKVREWARDNNHTVSERGRIPAEVLAAYEAAN